MHRILAPSLSMTVSRALLAPTAITWTTLVLRIALRATTAHLVQLPVISTLAQSATTTVLRIRKPLSHACIADLENIAQILASQLP